MRSIIGKRSDCRSHFVNHIYIFPGGMKSEMARAGAQLDFGKRRIIRRERAMCRVEVIYEQFVEPQVRGDSEAIVVGEFNLVCVRALTHTRLNSPTTIASLSPRTWGSTNCSYITSTRHMARSRRIIRRLPKSNWAPARAISLFIPPGNMYM